MLIFFKSTTHYRGRCRHSYSSSRDDKQVVDGAVDELFGFANEGKKVTVVDVATNNDLFNLFGSDTLDKVANEAGDTAMFRTIGKCHRRGGCK